SHIREVDAIVHFVRCFIDDNVTHVEDTVDPVRDINIINLELILSDMEAIEKRLDKAKAMFKTGDKKYVAEAELLQRIYDCLESEKPVRSLNFTDDERDYVKGLFLLTSKPVIYAANISESDIGKDEDSIETVKAVKEFAKSDGSEVLVISAKTEEEISELPPEDQQMFLDDLGLTESGLNRLVKKSYALLGLMSFLTAGEPETRAWTIKIGTKAPQAAGKIHTDFERGFIRAEVVEYQTLLDCGSLSNAREKGKVRSEGKEYVMRDGDVVLFRFNV
ncbi:MAG: redox-regulated ATPase YchF, partial [Clostridia bacterium]|nr:redox-regulated ATPase YchF [Clostridia bacterium]